MMAKKVKLSGEASVKADEIIAFHGYSSLEELLENLIDKEYIQIKTGDNREEQAEKLSGLGYLS